MLRVGLCRASLGDLEGLILPRFLASEKVKRCPYSVVLFDQVGKADPSIFKVFSQLLDDGTLTDGKGHVVDFKNTIIIMTSTLGAEQLTTRMGIENTVKAGRGLLMEQVCKSQSALFKTLNGCPLIAICICSCRFRNA